jgi:hypothetical protein
MHDHSSAMTRDINISPTFEEGADMKSSAVGKLLVVHLLARSNSFSLCRGILSFMSRPRSYLSVLNMGQ